MNFKILSLALIALTSAYSLILMYVEKKSFLNPTPENVKDVYDAETYGKWRAYSAEKHRLDLIRGLAGFAVTFLFIAFDVYKWPAGLFKGVFAAALAVTIFDVLTDTLYGLPFSYADDMKIEQKYGFNRTTGKTFAADAVKQMIISLIMSCGLTAILTGLHLWLGKWMALAFAAALCLLVLCISFLFPFFSKIFNKFTPLEDGELKEKLTRLLSSHGYQVRAIQVMDASRRSSKSNAYFTGFGRTKTIVLYDTLISAFEPDEICAVFAHEMGHGLHKDTLKNQILNFVNMALIACAAYLVVSFPEIYADFGFEGVNYGFAMILVGSALLPLISPLMGIITGASSRRAEYRADAQAVDEGYGEALVSALKKLGRENFSHLAPAKIIVKLQYSHPPLSERIDAIEKRMNEKR